MFYRAIVPSPKLSLSPHQALELIGVFLEGAKKANDGDVVLILCHHAETAISQAKSSTKKGSNSTDPEEQTLRERIAEAYVDLGRLMEGREHRVEAEALYKKAQKLDARLDGSSRHAKSSRPASIAPSLKDAKHAPHLDTDTSAPNPSSQLQLKKPTDSVATPEHIFPKDVRPPALLFTPPELGHRLHDTPQLACCIALLEGPYMPEEILDDTVRKWFQLAKNEQDETDRLKTLVAGVIRAFKRDELKDTKAVAEVMYLAPILENDDYRYLLREFYSGIEHSDLLDVHQLDGLTQLIQGADPGFLQADDLVKVLERLSDRLRNTHQQSPEYLYQLTIAVSRVLDAMADSDVKGLNRERLHEPLAAYLEGLKGSSDTYLVYQAAYAHQALLCVPDDETLWHATLRRTGKIVKGISGLVSAVKAVDLNGFVDGLKDIQQGIAGASEMIQVVKDAYEGAAALAAGGEGFFRGLKEGLSFSRKTAWYTALRGADTLIRDGQLSALKTLVYQAPCRRDVAFQWGVCQRLGDIAASSAWDTDARQGAIAFLGEIYQDDVTWGQHATVKQWILNILMQLSSGSGTDVQYTSVLLQDLQNNGDGSKQKLYQSCCENGPGSAPLKITTITFGSPSLLDRVQERPDVEGNLRQLRRQRMNERGNAVYIPPQAKANLRANDEKRFPLMEKVQEFLISDQKVFLVLGDSGAGKSTFNKELEFQLWQAYKKSNTIPLFINLPSIDKPEHDMISKQLRKLEFTEPQIRELKLNRSFILICDGYDESQQTHNLYTTNRLNLSGEWKAKMVISCRSEYIGVDYRDRFQPVDRNQRSESLLLQEAAITPFSMGQVQDYIDQYVSVNRPLWEAKEYKKALNLIPSLKDLVRNPFLMSLSLEVLPRMIDPDHDLSTTHITRVALYDQFMEQWFERGKKRLGEKTLSPLARAAFESLNEEGFAQNGIDYLKRLSVAVYKEQDGQPIVRYSRYKDENSWKSEFFGREEEKQLLREACPLVRNGNQYRFIHRSLLEYGVALAVFDPQDWVEKTEPNPVTARRGSTGSIGSYDSHHLPDNEPVTYVQDPDTSSPLVWRYFVNEVSLLEFLEERVQQEPQLKKQLLDYIEFSKKDKKWHKAASNAITILVRAGMSFSDADLRGIRIPRADLSHGVFDSAQLQGADLIQANLRGIWLDSANLSGARMTGTVFGELPYLEHDSSASSIAYSPDGKSMAVGLSSGQVIVYSTTKWETVWTWNDHNDAVICVAYSLDGKQIASGCWNGEMRLWEIETGESLALSAHTDVITSVIYSPQGDQLLSAGRDKTVKLWDLSSGDCRHTLTCDIQYANGVKYSPDGKRIVFIGMENTVQLWDAEKAECLHILSGHEGNIICVDYSPKGDMVASGSWNYTVRLWDVSSGECCYILRGHTSGINTVAFSLRGDQLASCSWDYTIRLWDVASGECLHILSGHSGNVVYVAYSFNDAIVASCGHDTTVRLWDTETGICRQTLSGHSGNVMRVAFSPKGNLVASRSNDSTVRLWDIGAGSSRNVSRGHSDNVYAVLCSPRGTHVATCSSDKTVRLWDVMTGECSYVLRGHTSDVNRISYSPCGYRLASGSYDNTVRIWDVETGGCIRTLSGHTDEVRSVQYSPQGDRLVSCSADTTARVWDMNSGECLYTLEGHTGRGCLAIYSPNGNQIASYSEDAIVRLWDVVTGTCSMVLIGHTGEVWNVRYSPDGSQMATASVDGTIRLWDPSTGDSKLTIVSEGESMTHTAFTSNGCRLAAGTLSGLVQLWDTNTGTCLQTLEGHSDSVHRPTFSSQGILASCSDDRMVRLWDVESGQCLSAIQFQAKPQEAAWVQISGSDHLVIGCQDGAVEMLRFVVDGDTCRFHLDWSAGYYGLSVTDATIQDVRGLSQVNEQLLKQRGAVGEPVPRLHEASKKLTSIASVISKLSLPRRNVEAEPTTTNTIDDQAARKSNSTADQAALTADSTVEQAAQTTNSIDDEAAPTTNSTVEQVEPTTNPTVDQASPTANSTVDQAVMAINLIDDQVAPTNDSTVDQISLTSNSDVDQATLTANSTDQSVLTVEQDGDS